MLKATFNNAGKRSRNWTQLLLDRITTCRTGGFPKHMIRIPVGLLIISLAAIFLATFASAEIVYKVAPSASNDHLSIEMDFDVSTPTVELQMPSWLGVYALRDSWETLHELTAADESGNRLPDVHTRGTRGPFLPLATDGSRCDTTDRSQGQDSTLTRQPRKRTPFTMALSRPISMLSVERVSLAFSNW
jgi:hypothetical protein